MLDSDLSSLFPSFQTNYVFASLGDCSKIRQLVNAIKAKR